MTLDPTRPRALYLQLADELRTAIRRGNYPPGSKLPTEWELVQQYGTSRSTVTQALAVLKAEGLLVATTGVGTFVRATPRVRLAASRFSAGNRRPGIGPWQATTKAAGLPGYVELFAVERVAAERSVAAGLDLAEGDTVIVRRRHLGIEGRGHVMVYDGFYPADLFDGTPIETQTTRLGGIANTFADLGIHPTRATETVGGRLATDDESVLLQLPKRSPVLTVVRVTRDDGIDRAVEVLHIVAAAAAVELVYEDLPLA